MLDAGPQYGNNRFNNRFECCTGTCFTAGCTGRYPSAGQFWSYTLDPRFPASPEGEVVDFCVGESGLIDVAAPLDPGGADRDYDLNGAEAGMFTGSRPDVGARESGAECR